MPATVPELLAAGRIETVPADPAAARARLSRAQRHLETTAKLQGDDNEMAYSSLYDAARKAITAHMLTHGLRVPAKPGAHETVGIYALERVPDTSGAVREFQRIRRRRNKSEYDDLVMGDQDVHTDLRHVRNAVAAVRADLG